MKMVPQTPLICLLLLLAPAISAVVSAEESKCKCSDNSITRKGFPEKFVFGAGSSAYQFEGAANENGRGLSMWDHFTHTYPGKILDHSNGDIAIDSYHRYKEDVKIARDLGLDAYRISISWTRILPGGRIERGVNQDGIKYYNNLINELLSNGIEPFVTIIHFDVPQALQEEYDGFLSARIVDDMLEFSDLLFRHFGDRVKHWITINEPWTFSTYGYAYGLFAPGRCSDQHGQLFCTGGDSASEPYVAAHNQLLAHSRIVNLYRNKYQALQKGKIGLSCVSYWFVPLDNSDENRKATDRAMDFMLGWFMEPLTRGSYPESMRNRVGSRLPEFAEDEGNMIKDSFDFIGFNYYGAIYAFHKPKSSCFIYNADSEIDITGERNRKPIADQGRNSSRIYIYPKGLREILRHMKERYNNPLIYITENGLDEAANEALGVSEVVRDDKRKDYIRDHLCCLHEAIEKDGANVKGYFVWSLIDNFEWAAGFSVRFGLVYVDFRDKLLRRYLKHSALWFKEFLLKRSSESQIRIWDQ